LPEIVERLRFLCEVGLGYLQLGRSATTLSGGEAQRIRLAAQLGSNLSGVLYVLDEPTIGLHSRDNEQLLKALRLLRARGNSLLVVEHDEATMRHADHIIDLGPGAGVHGGQVVAQGTLEELIRHQDSVTGRCLRAQRRYPSRGFRRPVSKLRASSPAPQPRPQACAGRQSLVLREQTTAGILERQTPAAPSAKRGSGATPCLLLKNACVNNLKNLTVAFPLNRLVVVTGVSGSGKSTLVRECLLPALQAHLERSRSGESMPDPCSLQGAEPIKAVYEVDQSPIGRTPRSIPATYVGFFDEIRRLFSQTPEARLRGYSPSRFSFNSQQGRCPACEGAGTVKLEMNFLPPAFIRCETCQGCRFNRETLDIFYRDKNVAQVLEMSVEEALAFFGNINKIRRPLEALRGTGLDYLQLGQISPTLSGGEAQRLKLVTHLLTGLKDNSDLFHPLPRHNLFILEEPTIGLHMADVKRLVDVLQRLVDAGHSVLVIEHKLDLIAEADWLIDLGPEAGQAGGQIVCQGTPEEVAANPHSHTGSFLRSVLPDA
jgi:excinuclease ABC subunit A